MKLIFEKSVPGRHCSLLPACDVPEAAMPAIASWMLISLTIVCV